MCLVPDLLCPLKHPSEIPTHPSMSNAYTSQALQDMAEAIETKLRQERSLLWRARNLYREFLGDSSWMPCGTVETQEDRWIFEPRMIDMEPGLSVNQGGEANALAAGDVQKNGEQESLSGDLSQSSQTAQDEEDQISQPAEKEVNNKPEAEEDTTERTREPKSEEVDGTIEDVSQHPGTIESGGVNGDNAANMQLEQGRHATPEDNGNPKGAADDDTGRMDAEQRSDTQEAESEKDTEMQDGSLPAPPRRMATRAQATTANSQEDGSSNRSTTPSNDPLGKLPVPHPLFLVPDNIRPDPNYGLPPNEAEDTRRLLWSYIQKQEETVRGFEHMLESLLRACRMKEDVLEWCKAEGHVGEMSDGEDWYDREKWGLAEGEELKKGADEDEIETVDDSRTTGKRGRGRRA